MAPNEGDVAESGRRKKALPVPGSACKFSRCSVAGCPGRTVSAELFPVPAGVACKAKGFQVEEEKLDIEAAFRSCGLDRRM